MNIVTIDIGGTAIKAGRFINGTLIKQHEVATMAQEGSQSVIERAKGAIAHYGKCDAIGISTAGQVDTEQGSICFANQNIPGYTGTPLKAIIQTAFGVPVAVENDVNAAAIGESLYGAAKGYKDFICLTFGTGVGGAIFINGSLYRGSRFVAGEFGHIITHQGGLSCACGAKGCYEQYASVSALVRQAMQVDQTLSDGKKIFSAIHQQPIRSIVDDWIQQVGVGISSLIHVFNPESVVLGGGIMAQPYITQYLNQWIPQNVMPCYSTVSLLPAQLGNNAGLYGAAALAKQALCQ